MDSYTPRLVLTGMLFLITLASGLWLSRLGKPYRPGIFNLHKLIALTTVILIGMIANGLRGVQEGPVLLELSLLSLAALLFLALFTSGALLSIGKPSSPITLKVHQAAPLLALFSSAAALYLLVASTL